MVITYGNVPSERELLEELDPIYLAVVIATNKKQDLALVKVGNFPKNISPVNVGSLREVNVGDKVYAIGHPEVYLGLLLKE